MECAKEEARASTFTAASISSGVDMPVERITGTPLAGEPLKKLQIGEGGRRTFDRGGGRAR